MVIAICDYSVRRVGLQLLTDSRTVNKNVILSVHASACRRQDARRVRALVQRWWCWSPTTDSTDHPGWFHPRGWQWVHVRYSEPRAHKGGGKGGKGKGKRGRR